MSSYLEISHVFSSLAISKTPPLESIYASNGLLSAGQKYLGATTLSYSIVSIFSFLLTKSFCTVVFFFIKFLTFLLIKFLIAAPNMLEAKFYCNFNTSYFWLSGLGFADTIWSNLSLSKLKSSSMESLNWIWLGLSFWSNILPSSSSEFYFRLDI